MQFGLDRKLKEEKSNPNNMRSSSGIINVAASTQKIVVDNRVSLCYYYRMADNFLQQAAIIREEKNIVDLYIMLLKFVSLASETIPYHLDYRASLKSDRISLKKKLLSALTELEELKPAVKLKIAELSKNHAYQSNGLESSKSLGEQSSVSQQTSIKSYTYTTDKILLGSSESLGEQPSFSQQTLINNHTYTINKEPLESSESLGEQSSVRQHTSINNNTYTINEKLLESSESLGEQSSVRQQTSINNHTYTINKGH